MNEYRFAFIKKIFPNLIICAPKDKKRKSGGQIQWHLKRETKVIIVHLYL